MHRFMLLLGLGATLLAASACDQGPTTPLTQAAARNDVAALRQLLDAGHKADEGGDAWTASSGPRGPDRSTRSGSSSIPARM